MQEDMQPVVDQASAFNKAITEVNQSERAHESLVHEFLANTSMSTILKSLQANPNSDAVEALHACAVSILNSKAMSHVLQQPDAMECVSLGLEATSVQIRSKMLKALQVYAADMHTNTSIAWADMSQTLATVVRGDDLSLADAASTVIIASVTANTDTMPTVVQTLVQCARGTGDSVKLLRFVHILARICAISSQAFEECRGCGAVDIIIEVTRSEDILVQLNALELLEFVGVSAAGIEYLFNSGEVSRLLQIAQGSSTAAPDPVLDTSALSVIQKLLTNASNVITSQGRYLWTRVDQGLLAQFLRAALSHVDSPDDASRLAAMHTICEFAVLSTEALTLVLSDLLLLQSWLSVLSSKVDLQAACLHSLARVLDPGVHASLEDGDTTLEMRSSLHKDLFDKIGLARRCRSTMEYLMKSVTQPLSEIRHAAFDVMRSVAKQPSGWGLRIMFAYATFPEFIVNRHTEFSKEGKEWKFSVIEAIAASPAYTLLGNEMIETIDRMLQQGPFYMPIRMAEMETMR